MHLIYKNGDRVTETGNLAEATALCEKLLAELPAGELATFAVQSEDDLLLAAISNRRIVGTFYKQRWGGRKNDYAITEGQEEFDATNAVLLLDHNELVELEDNAESTDSLGTEHVDWAGPHYVNIVDSILDYFGVPDLDDITPEALEFVRARVRPQKATVKTLTLNIKVDVCAAPGTDVSKLIENLDYSVTSKTPGIVVQHTQIEGASHDGAVPPAASDAFQHLVATRVDCMCQDDARGDTLVFTREDGRLVPKVIDAAAIDLNNLQQYEMILFDGGNSAGDSWKHAFFPKELKERFVNENPLPPLAPPPTAGRS